MKINAELKTSVSIGNSSVINDHTYKKLLECSFAELTRESADPPNVTQLYNSKPDVIKELHAAFLTLIAEFARHNANRDAVTLFLTSECRYTSSRANVFADLYDANRVKVQVLLGNIGTHLPHVVDVKWKIDYIVKSSSLDEAEGPVFRVCVFTERYDEVESCNKVDKVNFSCNGQELQDLVYKLKDATRHCQKIATEH